MFCFPWIFFTFFFLSLFLSSDSCIVFFFYICLVVTKCLERSHISIPNCSIV